MNDHDLIRLDLPPTARSVTLLGACVRAMLARVEGLNQPEELAQTIQSAAEEALAPSFQKQQHSAGVRIPATLSVERFPRMLHVQIGDLWEQKVRLPDLPDPSAPDPELFGSGLGMGLFLIRQMVDEVQYAPQAGGNRWHLAKRIPQGSIDSLPTANPQTIELDLPASHKYLNVLGKCIEAALQPLSLSDDSTFVHDVQLAAHEVCTNIIDHAYAEPSDRIEITLTLDPQAQSLAIDTFDSGQQTFDLAAVPDPFELSPSPRGGLLSGSALLFASATIVNAGNYLFNLVLGRWLGPSAFADLSLIVTLFLVVSFITVGFQQTAAKFSATYAAARNLTGLAGMRRWMRRWALVAGIVLMVVSVLGAPLWQQFFHTASTWPFIILGIGLPFYLLQGVDRGVMQGQTRFKVLAGSYQVEMWVRLLGAFVLIAAGWAVNGAVGAITLSLVAAWLVGRQTMTGLPGGEAISADERRLILLFTIPVLLAEISQILINHSDILIVKHFFAPEPAGQYAALALIGRMVFFATWSVVIVMFPIVAQRQERGENHRHLLLVSLGMVLIVSIAIIAASLLFPELIVGLLFGQAYLIIAPLLWLYAIATALYALSNVVVSYHLSLGNGAGTLFALTAGVVQVVGLWFFHTSLHQIVMVQIAIMSILFVALLIWDQWLVKIREPHEIG